MEKVKGFLEEKNINYNIKDNEIIVPYLVNNIKFQPTISFHSGKWIVVSALLAKKDQIPADNFDKLCQELLIANHELPEINYDISREGDVFTSADMRINIVDFDNFMSEFYAIPFGIKRFIEKIAPMFNITVTGFS